MSDDKTKTSVDRRFVNCSEDYEIQYIVEELANEFDRDEVRKAVKECCNEVGNNQPREEFMQCVRRKLS